MKSRSIAILLSLLLQPAAFSAYASTILLPQTGQTICYDMAGAEVDCQNSGQDGDKLAGVVWPSPRFTVNRLTDKITEDGTVTDNLTGLVWLKNANCFGLQDWQTALSSANSLASGACALGDGSLAGDWRLPNLAELESLVDAGQTSPAIQAGHPFGSVQNLFYWSSSTYADDSTAAWIVDFLDGYVGSFGFKSDTNHVWLVRDSKSEPVLAAPARLPRTGQAGCWDDGGASIDCAGTGQDGDKLKGAVWPDPRFSDNGNGTVTDSLTGLVWLKNANCFGRQGWQSALDSVKTLQGDNSKCSLNDGSHAGDWRLPNRKELQSLVDRQGAYPALPLVHPFSAVQFSDLESIYYWSSSSLDNTTNTSWFVDMYDGFVSFIDKSSSQFVWPVRDPLQNQAPTITEGDTVSVAISKNGTPTAFGLTLHATDADNDTLTWSVFGAASSGLAVAEASGAGGVISYSPTTGYVGQDSFVVQVDDGKGGTDSVTVNVTINQTHLVSTAVSGSGSINPNAPQLFNSGAGTTFVVNAATGYYVDGVSGCGGTLAGNSYATGPISADCTVTANFKPTLVKVPGNVVRTDYSTLQEAYANPATSSDMTILMQSLTFDGFALDRSINVTIKGGYDTNFQTNSGMTRIGGPFTIQSGSVIVEKLAIL